MKILFADSQKEQFDQRQEITTKGYVYLLDSGYVGLFSTRRQRAKMLFIYKPGDYFPSIETDNLSPVGQKLHSITLTPVRVQKISRVAFEEKVSSNLHYSTLACQHLGEITRYMIERINNLNHKRVSNRVIHQLVYLADRFGTKTGEKITLPFPMSHQDLADSIGTTRESVNREIRALEKEDLLRNDNQIITVLSLAKLTAKIHG